MSKIEIEIDDHILNNIRDYCESNDIELLNFASGAVVRQYTVEKYGAVPSFVKSPSETKIEPKSEETVIEKPKAVKAEAPKVKEESNVITVKSKIKRSRTIKSK